MHINLESKTKHSIQAYTNSSVKIAEVLYEANLLVDSEHLRSWDLKNIVNLEVENLSPLLEFNPEIIIIGHSSLGKFIKPQTLAFLAQQKIGCELMSLGAACRTYNVLLSEKRAVLLGLIFSS